MPRTVRNDEVQIHYRGELLRTYQPRHPMARGSTVRVRQRALQDAALPEPPLARCSVGA
jgi:hypothetical protein